ncbi:MAG: Bcr/CflA family efflux MFS transporter [Betaproteobacteria bacterium]|nr:Bcr/CflA family efflux MFS transporter [Betaproteobacteria bacterium]
MAEASASQSLISGRQRLGWALLLAALSSVGPFAIDTYLPAFEGIARSLQATPVQMQQSLSVYLIAFAVMNLFHGSISDAVGRKPVVLAGLAMFSLASIGCALATTIDALLFFRCLQGLCAGVGMVVSRAMVRDLFPPEDAQRMLSIVAIFFGVAPAIAPWIGGLVFIRLGWEAVFWFLAGLSGLLLVLQASLLPESLKPEHRQSIALAPMFKAYRTMLSSPRFLLLCVSSALPFNGFFLYVLGAAQFLGVHLRLEPDQYYWLFVVTVAGMMIGSALSSRLSGRFPPMRQVVLGLWIGAAASALNIALTLAYPGSVWMAIAPIGVYTLGWALMVPAVTVRAIDLYPSRRGMASSMQSFIGGLSNSLMAGLIVPAVMHSLLAMAMTSACAFAIGVIAWFIHSRVPLKPLDA